MTLANLLKDPLVSSLLSLDASARGLIVAACFSGMTPAEFWKTGSVATFTVDFAMYATIERHLFSSLDDRVEVNTAFDSRTVTYSIQHSQIDSVVDVRMIYTRSNQKAYEVHTDVDMLALNRLGLYLHSSDKDIMTRVPVPLGILMQNCEDRKFAVLTKMNDDVILLEKQKDLHRLGFSLRQAKVEREPNPPTDDKCSICQLDFSKDKNTVKTSCGHHYHADCWEKHLNYSIESGRSQLPTQFTFASTFSDVRAGAIYVNCPMCRESYRAYEVCIPRS